jgi:8-oxo-dGTP pyrophosphatase MutT (NUDIX family)
MIKELRKFLKLDSIEEKVQECSDLQNEMNILKAEIDVLASDFKDKSNTFNKAIADPGNASISDQLTVKYNNFLTSHITEITGLKDKYQGINTKLEKIQKAHPEIGEALGKIKEAESFKEIKKAYKSKIISAEKYNTIIKAKTGKVSYADVIVSDKDGKILLLKRSKDVDFEPEKLCLPGGHVEPYEDEYDAAIRELNEETGILVDKLEKVCDFKGKVEIGYYQLQLKDEPTIVIFEAEHENYSWMYLDDMKAEEMIPGLYDNLIKILEPHKNDILTIKKAFDANQLSFDLFNKAVDGYIEKSKGEKISKKSAEYVNSWDSENEQCKVCEHFINNDKCEIVKGLISPEGHCIHFSKGIEKSSEGWPLLESEGTDEQKAKFKKVMGEFASGSLKSSSGKPVKSRKQAIAIAYSESGIEKANKDDLNPEVINDKFNIRELKSFSNIFGQKIPNVDEIDTYSLYTKAQESGEDLDDFIEDLPLEKVEIEGLIPTQDFVDWDKLSEKIDGKTNKDRHPFIIKRNDRQYIFDGHHRLAADKLNGEKEAEVRLFDEDEPEYTEEQLNELIPEHEHLVRILEKYIDKDPAIKKEYEKQSNELKEYKEKLKEFKKAIENPFDEFEDIVAKESFDIIQKAFDLGEISPEIFEKAERTYKDNSENRRLKRVGKSYGSSKQNETSEKEPKTQEPSLEEFAKEASDEALRTVLKSAADEKVKEVARKELDNRENETGTVSKPSNFSIRRDQYNTMKSFIDANDIDIDTLAKAFGGLNEIETIENIYDFLGGANNIGKMNELIFSSTNNSIELGIETDTLSMERMYDFKNKEVTNFALHVHKKGVGFGFDIFKNQVDSYIKNGYKKILTNAIKSDNSNGYYTWARLGYELEDDEKPKFNKLVLSTEEFKSIKTLGELMSTDKGRKFWRDFGFGFMGTFDLSKNSENMKTLNKYIDGKSKNKK